MVSAEKQRMWKNYWEKTNEQPLISITIPKAGVEEKQPPRYLEAFHGGDTYQQAADKIAVWYDTHEFLYGSIPYYALSFGSDDFAAYIGADLKLADDGTTSWPNHILDSLENVHIKFDPNGKWWTKTVEFYHVLRRTLGDDVMIAAPTLSAGLDGLVGLYNAQDLIITMIDEPELVKEALAQINTAFTEIMKEVRRVFEFDKYGSINRHGMYVNGSIGVPQCDFSCMISSEMFREFALDSIAHEMSELDYAEYHLDGPGAIHHLEDLCTLEKLHTVQWVAGAGNAQKQDWTWLYQKIVSLGKAVLTGGNTSSVLALQNVLHTKSAYHKVSCQTRDEAERFMEELEKIEKN